MPTLKRIPLRGSWDAPTRTLAPEMTTDGTETNDKRDPKCAA